MDKLREQFKEWANREGYDTANTYDTDRSKWLWLNPMTVSLWAAWQAASQESAPVENELPPLPEPLEVDWPQLHSVSLGCGVEDRNIHDRYEAAEYGWQDGVDKAAERVPDAIYDADQMREYGRACAAQAIVAMSQQGPNNG